MQEPGAASHLVLRGPDPVVVPGVQGAGPAPGRPALKNCGHPDPKEARRSSAPSRSPLTHCHEITRESGHAAVCTSALLSGSTKALTASFARSGSLSLHHLSLEQSKRVEPDASRRAGSAHGAVAADAEHLAELAGMCHRPRTRAAPGGLGVCFASVLPSKPTFSRGIDIREVLPAPAAAGDEGEPAARP